MTPSLPFRDGLGRTHRVRYSAGGVTIPTRLSSLTAQVQDVSLLDEIKSLIERHNQRTGQHLVLIKQPQVGWCADCQAFVEAGQTCGCRS